MKKTAALIASIGFMTGCATQDMGSSARYSSGSGASGQFSGGITPLDAELVSAEGGGRSRAEASSQEINSAEIPLYREVLRVGKREVPKGQVVIRKMVHTQSTNIPVELRREEIVIERIAPDQQRAELGDNARPFEEQEVVIDLHREVPRVEREVEVAEVVRAEKIVDTQEQTITEQLRQEEIDVNRDTLESASNWRQERNEAMGGPGASESESASSEHSERVEGDNAEVFLHEEQVNVSKEQVPSGRVVLRKTVSTHEASQPIELRSEDVRIDRAPASDAQPRDQAFQSREIVIPLFEEVPMTQKEVRLAEIVRARTEMETEQQTIDAQIRREEVEIVRNEQRPKGNRDMEGSAQGAPAAVQSASQSSGQEEAGAGEMETFSGEIIAISPEAREVTVRNEQGQTRTFTVPERAELSIKENRDPSLWNFKVGYPVRIGHRGDTAQTIMRTDTPEVR